LQQKFESKIYKNKNKKISINEFEILGYRKWVIRLSDGSDSLYWETLFQEKKSKREAILTYLYFTKRKCTYIKCSNFYNLFGNNSSHRNNKF
jgi:hypothetical protein